MNANRFISLVCVLTLLATLFTGVAAAADDKVTVTYWGWDSNWYKPMFEAYSAAHPDSNIVFEPTDVAYSDLFPKVQQALASGSELPTLVPMNSTLMDSFKQLDICEDLLSAPYGAKADEWVDYVVSRNMTSDGKMIGLGENVTPAGLAYKRDLAKEYFGTDDPAELSKMFATYDDFSKIGAQVYEKSSGKVHLFHSGGAVAEWLYFSDQTEIQEGTTINFSAKMGFVMKTLCAMRDANAVDTFENGTPQANATYADDAHIMYPCPDWAITYYIKGNDPNGAGNWGVFLPGTGACSMGGTSIGITKQSTDAQKKAAWDFLTWALTTPDGAKANYSKAGYVTPYKTFCYDASFVKNEDPYFAGEDTGKLFYLDILPNVKIPKTSLWDQTVVDIRDLLALAVMADPKMTSDDAVKQGLEECANRITDTSLTIK
jgi:multiple sugar transport system substrate-binding protein